MDLVLNNLQRLICHKTQTTNQPTVSMQCIKRGQPHTKITWPDEHTGKKLLVAKHC